MSKNKEKLSSFKSNKDDKLENIILSNAYKFVSVEKTEIDKINSIDKSIENLVEAQKNCVEFYIDTIPVIKNTDKINNEIQNFKLLNGYSPETSGGLLIALAEKEAHKFIQEMGDNNESAWIVGKVIESDTRKVTICNMIDIINI